MLNYIKNKLENNITLKKVVGFTVMYLTLNILVFIDLWLKNHKSEELSLLIITSIVLSVIVTVVVIVLLYIVRFFFWCFKD